MNILHIIDHMGLGGAQRVVDEIISNYDSNAEVYCYALRKKDPEINRSNVFVRNTKNQYDLLSIIELKELIKENNIQIIHCHLLKAFLLGYILKNLYFKKIKLIFHEHGRIFRNKLAYNLFLNSTKAQVDLFIAVSKATKTKLIDYADINEKKIEVLNNFVDVETFYTYDVELFKTNTFKSKLGIVETDFVIGFAGRLDKIKGCEYLIKAVPYLLIPNFYILIAGDGSEKEKLYKLAEKLNAKNKVLFLGYVEDMPSFYRTIDLLVVPSEFEAFGLAAIEAQACGVPVIASDVEGLNEVIKHGTSGLLFPPKNEKELARTINLLYDNYDLRENIVTGGFKSVERYTLYEYMLNLNSLYHEI